MFVFPFIPDRMTLSASATSCAQNMTSATGTIPILRHNGECRHTRIQAPPMHTEILNSGGLLVQALANVEG